jgi:tetratricopeptide (TPR) repeat protein
MKLYLNELAPWERKNEYYHNIQLGKDVKNQTRLINEQTRVLAATQIANTNRIIASQARIEELNQQGFSDLSNELSEINCGINELKASFEWGISEIVWQIEQNREVLKSIEQGVWSPFDAQARNRKKQAQEAYNFGWIDESEEYFLESEQIVKIDFSVHISLGMIYLFHKIDKQKALTYFEKAIKYARPKSNFYTSFALLHKALIHFDLNDLENAIYCAIEAIELSPDLSEAYYQIAQYYAQSQQSDKCTDNLYIAINKDKNYCLKADNDPLFNPVRKNVNALFERIRKEEEQKAIIKINSIKEKHEKSLLLTKKYCEQKLPKSEILDSSIKSISSKLHNLMNIFDRYSYFDLLDLNNDKIKEFEKDQTSFILLLKGSIIGLANSYEWEKRNSLTRHSDRISNYIGNLWGVIGVGSFVVPILATLYAYEGWDKLWVIVFCIPVLSQIISIVFIYHIFFNYDRLIKGDLQATGDTFVAWSILVFLIISLLIYLISVISSKSQATIESKNQTNLISSIQALCIEAEEL